MNRASIFCIAFLSAFAVVPESAIAACSGTSTNLTCTSSGLISLTPTGTGTIGAPTSTPYPVTVAVSGLTGTLATITVQLTGLTHNDPEDLAFQLVAPDGSTNLVFMSDTDGYNQVTSATLAFSDAAGGPLPSGGGGSTGTFKPTSSTTDASPNNDSNYNFTVTPNYSNPLGTHTLNGVFAGLTGTNLNGTWKVYINDTFGNQSGDSGSLSSISLTITTATAVGTTTSVSASPAQVFTTTPGNSTTLTATVLASGNAVTTGTVTFTDNGSAIGSPVTLNGTGQASLAYSTASGEGSHVINATYNGSSGDLGSSGSASLEVDNHPTINGSLVCNGPVTLGNAVGAPSAPYGSRLYVPSTSYSGTVSAVTLSLNGVTTPDESSFALLLAAPGGSKFFIPMDQIGFNSGTNFSLSGINLVLNDSASSLMPSGAQLSSGTFLPSAYLPTSTLTLFPSPAPTATTSNYAGTTGNATFSTTFGGVDPVGTSPNNFWDLFVTNTTGSTGKINQWCLSFVTSSAASSTTTVTSSKNPSFVSDSVVFTAIVTSGGNPVTQGTVTFREGSTTLQGPTSLDANGKVTFTTTSLAEGMHAIEALYSGATGVANVSTGTITQEVDNHTVISNGGLTFCNPGTISLPNISTSSTPYPSRIFVSGLPGTLKAMSVALKSFTRADPSATAALLVGPQLQGNSVPQNLVLFSEAGDNTGSGGPFSVSNVNLLFQDGGSTLPQFAQITSGT
jgi:subtilisin-like proprotein convertase family protein